MQNFADTGNCCKCGSTTAAVPCGTLAECPSSSPASETCEKFYRQISTEMTAGNALIIRVEKDPKRKMRKTRDMWDPPCDCEMIEIRRPTNGDGAKIVNGGESNRILFKVCSQPGIPKDEGKWKPQAIAYKVGSCGGGVGSNDRCRTVTVHPRMDGPGSQEVKSDHTTEGNQDVYLLRVKKKPDTMDPRQRNIELELRTPRPPTPEPSRVVKVDAPTPVLDHEEKPKKETSKEKSKKGKGKKKK